MRHAMMKPAGTNVVGWSPHQLFLLLLLAWMIVVDSSSVSSSSSSSSNNNNMPGRVVKTKYGNLRGITLPGGSAQPTTTTTPSPGFRKYGSSVANMNNNVEAFLGIPYAAPPVGSLRYLPPASPGPWPGIRPASTLPPVCPQQMPDLANSTASLETMPRARYYQLKRMLQLLGNQSEDCLYLNIYAPSEGLSGGGGGGGGGPSSSTLPVTVLVHGESYSWGAGHLMDGGLLASKSRMIVVTLNYRLGILGFLQTAASPTPGQARGKSKSAIPTQGNYGLLDIMAALLWLKDNVAGFGGDSSRITLSGHGTGAALVNLLMISPLAAGLFQRAVLMSGSALSPWALNHQAGWLKAEVARQLDCGPLPVPESLADIGDCLRKRPLDSLLAVRLPATPRFCPTFAPFVDGAGIVAVDPLLAMQSTSQDFARIPLIAGVTSVESYRHTGDADLRNGISEERRDRTLRTLIRNFYQYHLNEIFYVLRNEYTDWDRPSALDALSMRDSLSAALSDALVVAPLMHVVHLHAQRSANPSGTFFYHFQGQVAAPNVHDQHDADNSEYHRLGSVTGDELESLQLDATANGAWTLLDGNETSSGNVANSNTTSTGDPSPSAGLLPFLTAFASTGDPNLEIGSKGELMPRSKLRWEPFNLHSQYYMVFGGGQQQHAHLKSHYRGHHIAVWLQLIPQLHQPGGAAATNGEPAVSSHHQFDQDAPVEQFYEGVVRFVNNTSGSRALSTMSSGPTATSASVECVSSFQRNLNGHNQTLNGTTSGLGDWTVVVNPNVMASETGSSSVVNGMNSSGNGVGGSVGGMTSRFGYFWTNQAALSITLVLGTFFLVVNLILFAAIYRRQQQCRRKHRQDDKDKDNTIQRMSDGRLEGRVATESIESMTDLRQLVSHCQQHPRHSDPSSIQQQPVFASSAVSDLAARAVELTDSRLPSPPFLLRAPPPHHQFLLDESNRSATLPGNRRPPGGHSSIQPVTANHLATVKSTREITV